MQKRFLRFPATLAMGGMLTYVLNYFILRPIYLSDLEQMGLTKKYFGLDLNADMMRSDLENLGISITARHFNMAEIQSKADAEERALTVKTASEQQQNKNL